MFGGGDDHGEGMHLIKTSGLSILYTNSYKYRIRGSHIEFIQDGVFSKEANDIYHLSWIIWSNGIIQRDPINSVKRMDVFLNNPLLLIEMNKHYVRDMKILEETANDFVYNELPVLLFEVLEFENNH